ncbi:MAG: CapA family protein [Candidatus Berkelbacteria bacterium]|nr:CapA family protein [Candidatus Berkelbacteria bacterium]
MIIAGDVAIAHDDLIKFDGFPERVYQIPWCVNLEGAISPHPAPRMWGTYNSPDWIESFEGFKIGPVFTANNHIHDTLDGISLTYSWLSERGLAMVGAGINSELATRAENISSGEFDYSVLGFGWPVIGCSPVKTGRPGINSFETKSVRSQARRQLSDASNHRVIILIHANYEFEKYPQPAHRKLAMELIDMGVYSVIFHHPHVVGPIERYRDRLIAYSLGNWAFSYGRFFDGKLKFPESSFHQIAVELGDSEPVIHHANFSPPSNVTYDFSERFSSRDFTLRPEFEGYSHKEYINWFRKNRIKRKGLPVYKDPDAHFGNAIRDQWVRCRQVIIDLAAKSGLKKMRNAK